MISIAVCDDNEITAQEISEKVKQCCPIEAEVSVFYHIKDILFSIHNENKLFDIIFMDIEFDVSSGIEASKQINAWHPDCQIIYITNYTNYFTDITYLLYFKERYRYLSFNRIKKGHTADSKDKSVLFDYPIKAAAYSYCTK